MRAGPAAQCDLCPWLLICPHGAQMSVAFSVVFFARLGDALEAFRDLLVEDVSIAQGVADVGMVEHLLHELEVASLTQRLGREIVPEIVEAEADDAGRLTQPVPMRPQSGERDRIALALHPS